MPLIIRLSKLGDYWLSAQWIFPTSLILETCGNRWKLSTAGGGYKLWAPNKCGGRGYTTNSGELSPGEVKLVIKLQAWVLNFPIVINCRLQIQEFLKEGLSLDLPIRPERWGEAQIKLNQTKYPPSTLHCYWTGLFAGGELCAMSPLKVDTFL